MHHGTPLLVAAREATQTLPRAPGYSQVMTSSNGTRPDPTIHGMVRDVPTSAGPARGEVGGCVPRRFYSVGEATRDIASVLLRGPLLARAYAGGLDRRLRERVMVAVSQVNACSECTRAHQSWARRAGVSPTELEALSVGDLERLDPRSRAAVTYAVARAESHFGESVPRDVEESAREHLSAGELNQIDAVARAMALANLSLSTLTGRKPASRTGAGQHPVFAWLWSHTSGKVGSARERSDLLAGLRGDGTGRAT